MKQSDTDMRDAFFDEVYKIVAQDKDVVFLTADHAAFSLIRLQKDFPNQYINVGIAEQNLVSVAAGLALSGKKVFVYTIVNFLTLRCLEQISVDLASMNLNVNLVGVGSGFTYSSDGPTHHGVQDLAAIASMPNMTILNSSDAKNTNAFAHIAYKVPGPTYIIIEKGKFPEIYPENTQDFTLGLALLKPGNDLKIISTGAMVQRALEVAEELDNIHSIKVGVIDLYRIKPINDSLLLSLLKDTKAIVTIEEYFPTGGIGSMIGAVLMDHERLIPCKRFSLPDEYCFQYHVDRNWMLNHYGLGKEKIVNNIIDWVS